MCNENKNEACIIVHPSAQLPPPQPVIILFISAHDEFSYYRVREVIGQWPLSMAHLVLLTVRSVSLP